MDSRCFYVILSVVLAAWIRAGLIPGKTELCSVDRLE
jgi:hypothetical protein